jgi:hypothetical protein
LRMWRTTTGSDTTTNALGPNTSLYTPPHSRNLVVAVGGWVGGVGWGGGGGSTRQGLVGRRTGGVSARRWVSRQQHTEQDDGGDAGTGRSCEGTRGDRPHGDRRERQAEPSFSTRERLICRGGGGAGRHNCDGSWRPCCCCC